MLFSYLVLLASFAVSSLQLSCKTQFFDQKVDHKSGYNSGSSPTFKQQYQVISDYYKPGGPIFFYQGAESPALLCVEELVMTEWAKEVGAYLVGIEHRFFGKSIPSNDSDVTEKYETLTLDNVMADSVELISHLKSTTPEIASAKVIIFGGR